MWRWKKKIWLHDKHCNILHKTTPAFTLSQKVQDKISFHFIWQENSVIESCIKWKSISKGPETIQNSKKKVRVSRQKSISVWELKVLFLHSPNLQLLNEFYILEPGKVALHFQGVKSPIFRPRWNSYSYQHEIVSFLEFKHSNCTDSNRGRKARRKNLQVNECTIKSTKVQRRR